MKIKITQNKYIIRLKDESAHERFLDRDGYLTQYIYKAETFDKLNAEYALSTLDEPLLFMIAPLRITYETEEYQNI